MDEENEKSIDEIRKRLDKLSKPIKVTGEDDFMTLLLRDKSPQYHKRFSAWCRHTLEGPYYQDMLEAYLSLYGINILLGSSVYPNSFIRGQVNQLLKQFEDMQRLSNVEIFNKDK